ETYEEHKKRLNCERQQHYRNKKKKLNTDNRDKSILSHQLGERSDATNLHVKRNEEPEDTTSHKQTREMLNIINEDINIITSSLNLNFSHTEDNLIIASTVPSTNISSVTAQTQKLKARIYLWSSVGLNCHNLGNMKHRCRNCCCAGGKICLPPFHDLPPPLNALLTRMDSEA
ncbi:10252_t:CDS:2, partial [Cetraspora pellucida]